MTRPLITYQGAVYPWHCDHMGHMNVMWYVGKFDEGTWRLFGKLGLSPTWLRENDRGMAAVEQRIEYRRELKAGDTVSVETIVVSCEGKVLKFRHEMRNDETGEVAAITELTAVHLDTVARKAAPFPDAVVARAAELRG
jgi:acyl-CoA thioester hydrolase